MNTSYTFPDSDSFKFVAETISTIHEELAKIHTNESYKSQDTQTKVESKGPQLPPKKTQITRQEAINALNSIDIPQLEIEIKRWHIILEMCGLYNVASNAEHTCTISCRNMDALRQVFDIDGNVPVTSKKTRLFKLPQIMYIWDVKYAHIIQKMLEISYLQSVDHSKSFVFSLSEKHNLYGCFSSGKIHLCHPIVNLRQKTCSNTIVIDAKSGSASCGFSGLSIPHMDDTYVADKNLCLTETYNNIMYKPGFNTRKDVNDTNANNKTSPNTPQNLSVKRKLFSDVEINEGSHPAEKDHYVHNLGSSVRFKYDSISDSEKINADTSMYFTCLKNTCLVIYWYKNCIVSANYDVFNSKQFDATYDKYWRLIKIIFPKIHNMYQSYTHAHTTSNKKAVYRKCNTASLLMGLCGLLSEGLVVYQTSVIDQMNISELCFTSYDVEKLGWDKDYIGELYTQKFTQIKKQVGITDDVSGINENDTNMACDTQQDLLTKSYRILLDSLIIINKNKNYNQQTLFCEVVTKKSGDFSYITAYNNGTKTITDICHECDMDPKTMKRLFYFS